MTPRARSTRASATAGSLSCTAVARALGVAPNTVRHWCREGWLQEHATVDGRGHYQVPRRVFERMLAGELTPPPARPQARRGG